MSEINAQTSREEQEKELIERAKILFEHQKEQYKLAIDGVRRLEDKAMKLFSALSIILTLALLIIRNWWIDIFPETTGYAHYLCWGTLSCFLFFSIISWGYTFSAMQLQDFEKPSTNSDDLESFYMYHPRFNSLASYAREYERLTKTIDLNHIEKVKMIKNCSEAMLFGAWSFFVFLITFIFLKLHT